MRERVAAEILREPLEKPFVVSIEEAAERGRAQAYRAYWAALGHIAEQCKPQGRRFRKEAWHCHFCELFLPIAEEVWPDGKVHLERTHLADLSVQEIRDLRFQVEAWAVERGVSFPQLGD